MTSYRYTLLGRVAGNGTMDLLFGRVATEPGVDRLVVVKRLRPDTAPADDTHRFLDRARHATTLQHPNLVRALDVGWLAGGAFVATEYFRGHDLRALRQRLTSLGWRLSIGHSLYIAMQVLSALHHLHELTDARRTPRALVHGGVAASSILMSHDGAIKLCAPGATPTTCDPGYLSPEQCQRTAVDRRSDVFSLGVVLHELLTGRPLYGGGDPTATMVAIATDVVPRPSSVRPDVARELDALVLRALAKDPAKRFATAAEMLAGIDALARREDHMASAASLRQFLAEVVGEAPAPWLLTSRTASGLTITSEPVIGDARRRPMTSAELVLDAQLRELPDLSGRAPPSSDPRPNLPGFAPVAAAAPVPPPAPSRRTPVSVIVIPPRGGDRTSGPIPMPRSALATPRPGSTPPTRATPAVTQSSLPVVDADAPPSVVIDERATSHQLPSPSLVSPPAIEATPFLPPPAPRRSRGRSRRVALGGLLVVASIAAAIPFVARERSSAGDATAITHAMEQPAPAAPRVRDDAVATIPAVTPPPAAVTPPAASASPAVEVPASAPPEIAARPVVTDPVIASVAAAPDWAGIFARCMTLRRSKLSQAERTICGIAACRRGQTKAALAYRNSVSHPAPIDEACNENLSLPTRRDPEDQCERYPLRCRN